jgi:hypothetical protein
MNNAFPTRMGRSRHCPPGGVIIFSRYMTDDSPAIRIATEDGELLTTATVCLDVPPPDGHVWLKGWTENEGIPEALQAAGVLRLTGGIQRAGHAVALLAELTEAAKALVPTVEELKGETKPAPAVPQFQRIPRPLSSPWGKVDGADEVAPGIWAVSTPSHGGFILSQARLQAMPAYLRINKAARDAHAFEEDCEWALVVMAFPDEFPESDRYNAGRVISSTSQFSFPGFDSAPWKVVLEKHPPLRLSDLSRQTRIELAQNFDRLSLEQATARVDAGEDLKGERA